MGILIFLIVLVVIAAVFDTIAEINRNVAGAAVALIIIGFGIGLFHSGLSAILIKIGTFILILQLALSVYKAIK